MSNHTTQPYGPVDPNAPFPPALATPGGASKTMSQPIHQPYPPQQQPLPTASPN